MTDNVISLKPEVAGRRIPATSGAAGIMSAALTDRVVQPQFNWKKWKIAVPPVILLGCACLFIGSDVAERHYFPDMQTGLRHLLLTIRSAMVTGLGCAAVYFVMRHQQKRIDATAEQLGRRLEAYHSNGGSLTRFENPHLFHRREVKNGVPSDCPMVDSQEQRCWQLMALSRARRDVTSAPVSEYQCHECAVYRSACPDGLTRLGESFNSLMFMLDAEAARVNRMHSQMAEKEKMIAVGQMAAGIAHEIGNPLSSISSIVQMLKRKPIPAPDAGQLDLIQQHIHRISETVRQLGSLARPAAQRWELVDLGLTLRESVTLVSFDPRARNVKFHYDCPSDLPKTYALRSQIQQVFINLMLNALDAMPKGGELRIGVEPCPNRLDIYFEDTGDGIPHAIGRRVFEPFFTTKEQGKGSGLGLSVSYGIVQEHNGTIDFVSSEGCGTRFIVGIPILSRPPEA